MPDLVLLAGVPGVGKSTWARTFFDLKYAIVSSDVIRKQLAGSIKAAHTQQANPWDEFYGKIRDYLNQGVDVIADATFLTQRHRDKARVIADETKARLHLVLFTNCFVAQLRNNQRDEDTRVPDDVMESMLELFRTTLAQVIQEEYASVTQIESFG